MQKGQLNKVISFLVSQKISQFQFMTPKTVNCKDAQFLFHNTSPYKLQEIFKRIDFIKLKPTFVMIDRAVLTKKKIDRA